MKRTPIIAGNWKMNKTPDETAAFIKELLPEIKDSKNELIAAVPFVCLPAALEAARAAILRLPHRTCTGRRAALIQAKFPAQC